MACATSPARHGLLLKADDKSPHSVGGAECIVLGGQPLGEPVVSYGPFVMNDRSQIQRCIADYRAGRMGTL